MMGYISLCLGEIGGGLAFILFSHKVSKVHFEDLET